METFAEYLTYYVNRAGISDSELARAINVSRQTVFRWKEGATSRPSNRADVLAIAEKLRLSSEERDTLLLVAGFRPERLTDTATGSRHSDTPDYDEKSIEETSQVFNSYFDPAALWRQLLGVHVARKWAGLAIVFVISILALIGWAVLVNLSSDGSDEPSKSTPDSTIAGKITPSPSITQSVNTGAGQYLVVVPQFAGNTRTAAFSARLINALEREISSNRLTDVQITPSPEIANEKDQAISLSDRTNASLVFYGDFEFSELKVHLYPDFDDGMSANQLTIPVDTDSPFDTQALALLSLGHVYINNGSNSQALPLLAQARNVLRSSPGKNEQALVIVNALLSLANQE